MEAETSFAAMVRGRRAELGLSQAALADLVGRSASAIRSWERGASTPSDENVVRSLAAVLGVPDADLRAAVGLPAETPAEVPEVAGGERLDTFIEEEAAPGFSSEEDPARKAPVEDEPVPVAPVEYESVGGAPVEDEPVPVAPDEDEPVPGAPVEDEPVPVASVEDESVGGAPVEDEPDAGDSTVGREDSAEPAIEAEAAANAVAEPPLQVVSVDDSEAVTAAVEPPGVPSVPPAPVPRPPATPGASVTSRTVMMPAGSRPTPPSQQSYLDDPDQLMTYWLRTGLTVALSIFLLVVLIWALGRLGESIGEIWDLFRAGT